MNLVKEGYTDQLYIKKLMTERKQNISRLAEVLGVSKAYVSACLQKGNKKHLSSKQMKKLSEIWGLDYIYLYKIMCIGILERMAERDNTVESMTEFMASVRSNAVTEQ